MLEQKALQYTEQRAVFPIEKQEFWPARRAVPAGNSYFSIGNTALRPADPPFSVIPARET